MMLYVGPGAGFAFLGSFLTLVTGFLLGAASLLAWPFRMAWRALRRRTGFRRARVRRVIFLGLDGLDPGLTERFMADGDMPNLARLKAEGTYRRLRTTFPAMSPVAWSTFATGVSPAKHNIFDFLNRSLQSYRPELSSARVEKPHRVLRLGRLRIPLSRPTVELRRKSQPFWKVLGEHGIPCTVLRVPITFPPEDFPGRLLSAMCTPDLKGTQGSFSQFSTRLEKASFENGARYPLRRAGEFLEGALEGPEDLRIPFRIRPGSNGAALEIDGGHHVLARGEYSGWIPLRFRGARGIARFLVTETSPEFSLYVSPINLDPERPALPISHPSCYAPYLASLLGPFATVGMAEDTWALNESVIDEEAFLKQTWLIYAEREAMFLSALETTRRGMVACVFDTSDRVQHMFFRQLESGVIRDLYRRMDALVGKALAACDEHTALFVLSDHGFRPFRRGVNLNSWLRENGYLALDGEAGPFLAGVDWSRTKAYTFGLAGLYLNLKGREAQGIVAAGEAEALKRELIARLTSLRDGGDTPIRNVYSTRELYRGPYLDAAPDLIVGYNEGYRASWDAALGKVTASVFEDNAKAWSGDHCIDPPLVPGVLFSNLKLETPDPGIEDLAPTALALFGVDRPAYMEGQALL